MWSAKQKNIERRGGATKTLQQSAGTGVQDGLHQDTSHQGNTGLEHSGGDLGVVY